MHPIWDRVDLFGLRRAIGKRDKKIEIDHTATHLLEKNRPVPFARSQKNDHDPAQARQWLGGDLATVYLKNVRTLRWPQEDLTTRDIVAVWG